ncbi:hypothetical protein INT47_006425, partial [Mucor saturninus]
MSKKAESVTPGQRLGYAADYTGGPGTYERDGLLYASVVGQRYIDPSKNEQLPTIRVSRDKEQSAVPEVGSVITGKVIALVAVMFCFAYIPEVDEEALMLADAKESGSE